MKTKDLQPLLEFAPTHLAWPLLPNVIERLGRKDAEKYLKARKAQIEDAERDPLYQGYTPEIWDKVDWHIKDLREKFPKGVIKIIIFGGHRSSKTRKASNYVNNALVRKPGSRWWCCDSTEAQSRANQMRLMWEQFPPQWKNLERDQVTDIRYSQADGFSKNLFICPNKSEVAFKFYSMDLESLPGPELDGVWCFISGTQVLTPTHGNRNIEELRAGDFITTAAGSRRIETTGSRLADTGRVRFSNGQELVGTFDHPVWTMLNGWTRLGELKKGDFVFAIDAQRLGRAFIIPIREDICALVKEKNDWSYTEKFGKSITARFQRAMTFITRMATSLITRLKIWNVYLETIISGIIFYLKGDCLSLIGLQNKFLRFRVSTAERLSKGSNANLETWYVEHANSDVLKPREVSRERAKTAERRLSVAAGNTVVSVASTWEPVGEQRVYNLKVAETPNYYANGILVHNCDELVPLDWVHFLGFRCANRNGIIIITFCPEFGWNETFGHYYEGAQVLDESEAPLLPKCDENGVHIGHKTVPRVMQCQDPTARIIFFHTSDNPFGNYEGLVQELKSKQAMEPEIMVRAYGLCTRAHNVAFPMFNKRAHVITTQQFAEIVKQCPNADRFHLVDPCDGRMWFMGWVFCPRPDKWIIYREFPSYGHKSAYIEGVGMPGPWALSGEAADGVKGPGQDSKGFSLERYREEIEKRDAGESVRARYIDSRYATSPRIVSTTVTNLQEQLMEVGIEFLTMVPGVGRIINDGRGSDGSVDLINSALSYDIETEIGKFSAKLGRLNEPQLQIVETCPNVIDALEHWTGEDNQKGARKDPIDVLRGMFLSGINFVGEDQYVWRGGGITR